MLVFELEIVHCVLSNLNLEVAKLCLTLSDPVDWNSPGSSIHGVLQARILEWLPFLSPGDLLNPGIKPTSFAFQADFLPLSHKGRP